MDILQANKKLFAHLDTITADYSDAAQEKRDAYLSTLCVKSMNAAWCSTALGTSTDTTRLLFGLLFSYKPRCSREGECPPSTLAFTDGQEVVVSSDYFTALESFVWPKVNMRALSSMDRELAGTLMHEAAHLFLDHPARMARILQTSGVPKDHASKCFNIVADVLVEHLAGASTPGYSGSATSAALIDQIGKMSQGVVSAHILARYTAGAVTTEEVVRKLLEVSDPDQPPAGGGSAPDGGTVVVPKAPLDEVQQKRQTAVHAAAAQAGVGSHPLLDAIAIEQPAFTLADAMTVACTRASLQRNMQRMHPAFSAMRIALPSRRRMPGAIAVALDSSASVSNEELHNAVQQISGIAQVVGASELIVFTFDGSVGPETRIPAGDPVREIDITNRGGTSFNSAVRKLNELAHAEKLAASIIITDGEDSLRVTPKEDLIWAFTRTPRYGDYNSLPGQHVFLN